MGATPRIRIAKRLGRQAGRGAAAEAQGERPAGELVGALLALDEHAVDERAPVRRAALGHDVERAVRAAVTAPRDVDVGAPDVRACPPLTGASERREHEPAPGAFRNAQTGAKPRSEQPRGSARERELRLRKALRRTCAGWRVRANVRREDARGEGRPTLAPTSPGRTFAVGRTRPVPRMSGRGLFGTRRLARSRGASSRGDPHRERKLRLPKSPSTDVGGPAPGEGPLGGHPRRRWARFAPDASRHGRLATRAGPSRPRAISRAEIRGGRTKRAPVLKLRRADALAPRLVVAAAPRAVPVPRTSARSRARTGPPRRARAAPVLRRGRSTSTRSSPRIAHARCGLA